MPIKSKAQRRKFAQLLVEGKISPETFEEWNRGAGNKKLPERLHPKGASKRKPRKRKSKPKPKSKTKTRSKTNSTKPESRARRR